MIRPINSPSPTTNINGRQHVLMDTCGWDLCVHRLCDEHRLISEVACFLALVIFLVKFLQLLLPPVILVVSVHICLLLLINLCRCMALSIPLLSAFAKEQMKSLHTPRLVIEEAHV